MEPGQRPRSKELRPLAVAGLVALALLGLGEAAPAAFPIDISLEGHGQALRVTVDGQSHELASALGGNWRGVSFEQPGPLEREYQIDGSDTTATQDRSAEVFTAGLLSSPLYQFDAWLRDESGYSRWEHARVVDLTTGQAIPSDAPLPRDFRIEAALRRPEAAARAWLNGGALDQREGLELDRDRRNARWIIQRGGRNDALPRWFLPEQPAPFAAELLHLLGRAAAAAVGLILASFVLGWLLERVKGARLPDITPVLQARLAADAVLGAWLLVAALVTARLYQQLPHILDAMSYTFQAGLVASGKLALAAPPLTESFRGPFEVLFQGRLFSQYPPGAPAAYAVGRLVGLEWLIGPLACLALIGATAWTAGALHGRGCGMVALTLGALSPFVLFQAGSFLSHPIAAGLLAPALAAFVAAEREPDAERGTRWYGLCGALLGAAFLTREAASVLFGAPLAARLLANRRWRPMVRVALFGLPFLLAYLIYNQRLTGSALVLPRTLFNANDHFGFGDGVGFHGRHTLAAGLANTDELLTMLQLDLFGWPPLFALGLLMVPFLLGRNRDWDRLAAAGLLTFVAAYAAYFYHGIALGPRYYFEAMPWLLLLAARGAQLLGRLARGPAAAGLVIGVLMLNTLLFYLPHELERRADFSGVPGGIRFALEFVQPTLLGPRFDSSLPVSALVVTDDWWLFNASLSALNCPRLPDCGAVFALATTPAAVQALQAQFPDRVLLRAVNRGGAVQLISPDGAGG